MPTTTISSRSTCRRRSRSPRSGRSRRRCSTHTAPPSRAASSAGSTASSAVATYKEGDEAGEALFGETEDKAEDNASSDESPLHWRRRGPAPPRPRSANNEAEDTAGSTEAPSH